MHYPLCKVTGRFHTGIDDGQAVVAFGLAFDVHQVALALCQVGAQHEGAVAFES